VCLSELVPADAHLLPGVGVAGGANQPKPNTGERFISRCFRRINVIGNIYFVGPKDWAFILCFETPQRNI